VSPAVGVRLAVDHLDEAWPRDLCGPDCRVGALLHSASVNGALQPTLAQMKAMADAGRFRLSALFGPQHGFESQTQDNMIEWQGFVHPRLGIPVFSLYGEVREPTDQMLESIDVLFVDLVDIGSRYYTFIWTLFLCLRACERAGIPVVVVDRPNPLGGEVEEGIPQRDDYLSFVGLHPLPNRHGKTIGELARQFCDEKFPDCQLEVLAMEGWQRASWFDQTGLPWVLPSPNMPTLDTAIVYPGMCLLEGTNLSEARGTTRPFELFGAPWIDGYALCEKLNRQGLPGVHFREAVFEPKFQKHADTVCRGAQIHVTDRDSFLPWRSGIEVIRASREMWPDEFSWKQPPYEYETQKLPIEILLGGPVDDFFEN
jgi:uncharacterized protein YbbC (DUF1343 family)